MAIVGLPSFCIPPIGPKQGKVWGTTQLVFAGCNVECHLLRIKAGGYSSLHTHAHKWNRFVVLSGSLIVSILLDGNGGDETIIGSGQITDVPPGVRHQFRAREDSDVLEIYWVALDAQDIDRGDSKGGFA